MCYNCGCNMPGNDMGKGNAGVEPDGKSVTEKTFAEAGKSMGQTTETSRKNSFDLLKKVLGEKPSNVVKDASGFDRYDDVK